MLKQQNVTYSYTIETSVYGYGSKNNETLFSQKELQLSGGEICSGLKEFFKIILTLPKRIQLKQESPQKSRREGKSERLSAKSKSSVFEKE